ncbi:Uncharacterised protein [uncultured archaeon]|nr:Uncharacterised protein [uncultured archaeon]
MDNKTALVFAGRIFVLLVLPFLLGMYVFPHSQYVNGQLLSTPLGNKNANEVLSYSFSPASHAVAIVQGIGSAFPLSNFLDFPPLVSHDRMQLCFQDNGSTITLPNGTQMTPQMQWQIYVNNNTPISLQPYEFACTDVASSEQVVYAWQARINTGLDTGAVNGTILFNPQTLTYPRQLMDFGLLQGIAMIPVFYLLVWYPVAGIWKKLHEGLLSQ